jgi:hypothetical protein
MVSSDYNGRPECGRRATIRTYWSCRTRIATAAGPADAPPRSSAGASPWNTSLRRKAVARVRGPLRNAPREQVSEARVSPCRRSAGPRVLSSPLRHRPDADSRACARPGRHPGPSARTAGPRPTSTRCFWTRSQSSLRTSRPNRRVATNSASHPPTPGSPRRWQRRVSALPTRPRHRW